MADYRKIHLNEFLLGFNGMLEAAHEELELLANLGASRVGVHLAGGERTVWDAETVHLIKGARQFLDDLPVDTEIVPRVRI
jgi:hypothetical protein